MLSQAIAGRAHKPFIALNNGDAKRLNVSDGEMMEIALAGKKHRFGAKIKPELPDGTAGLYAGLSLFPVFGTTYAKLSKV